MKEREHQLPKTDVETGGMIVEEERIRKENEMIGSQVGPETTEMKENLVTAAVIVETSERTVTGERQGTPGRAVRLEIVVTIETLKKTESRRIHVLPVTLMIIERETTVNPTGKMISMMNAPTEEVTGKTKRQDLIQEMIGMTAVMNQEVRPGMIGMAERVDVHQTPLKKVVEGLEVLRWIATAAAVTMTTGIQGVVIRNVKDTTTVNRVEILHLIVDMGTENDVNGIEIKG